jgi:hypothetical protein
MDRRHKTYCYVLAAVLALAAMFAVSGCGDDYLVSENNVSNLKQHIFVLPDRYSGQPYLFSVPVKTVYLDTNETVKFWAAYSISETYMTSDSADKHYINHSWTIEGEEYNISPLRFSFKTPGYRQAILQTVDLLMDTLRDTLNIYVNTPISISLIAPVNGYNQVKPNSSSEVEIRWSLSGLDPWETSLCNVYASFDPKEVWNHNLGFVDCNEDARFVGSFIEDSLQEYLDEHPEKDTSVTIFWGMRAAFHASEGFVEADSTEIFHFSTLFLHEDSSVVTIPIVYEDYRKTKVSTHVIITDNMGDTLFVHDEKTAPSTVSAKVAPQTGLHIYVQERSLREFQAEPTIVNTSPGAQTLLDTIKMQDRVQPQIAPRSIIEIGSDINAGAITGDTVYFYALDNGSGINQNRITVTADSDTLDHVFEEPFIKFKTPCKKICKVRIYAEDYAHNSSPKLYWNFIPDASRPTFIGPYSELGGE